MLQQCGHLQLEEDPPEVVIVIRGSGVDIDCGLQNLVNQRLLRGMRGSGFAAKMVNSLAVGPVKRRSRAVVLASSQRVS